MNKALSVIIVTWNGLRYLPRCLDAFMPQLPPEAEVILVDNGSTDGTLAWVGQQRPELRLIALGHNTGFAGGVAAGLRVACGELILLLNDDAFVEHGCVAALLAAMTDFPEYGAAGGILTFDHRPDLVASAGIRLRGDAVALDLWAGHLVATLPDAPVEILGPSGGLALYRRRLLEDVGGFDPGFFAYLEDVDLAWRMALRGWRAVVVPQAQARHVYSATGGQGSPLKQRLLARNRVRAIVRSLPHSLLLRHALPIIAYDLMAMVYGISSGQPAIVAGRLAALHELPALLQQRQAIQARRTAPVAALARWFEPTPPPWRTMREAQQLDAILHARNPAAGAH